MLFIYQKRRRKTYAFQLSYDCFNNNLSLSLSLSLCMCGLNNALSLFSVFLGVVIYQTFFY